MKTILWSLSCLVLVIVNANGMAVSEPEQLALESSGELLPPSALVDKIKHDLTAIRTKFPAVKDVTHSPKWNPGKLIIHKLTPEKIKGITGSTYGPIESKPIFLDKIYMVTFAKPYHPRRLAEILSKEFKVVADPDGFIGGSSSITFSMDGNGKATYVFTKGSGDCQAGCINKHGWTFTVGPDKDQVELVGESGSGGES